MKTLMPTQLKNEERKWYIVDAEGQTLGRLATQLAVILKGKNKPSFSPHLDNGDYIVVINSEKISVTGNKLEGKIYYRHTGFLGGLKEITLGKLLEKKPSEALKKAVSGMLPKNKLRSGMLERLKLVVGQEHTYQAQQPEKITL
ncbi:MAG: 50S ribosomal protein L13 [Candidatus Gracilibacteria bacterium]|nr:50S ribosomal protein L13 [Candidatus Gracilibacteria bacterium]